MVHNEEVIKTARSWIGTRFHHQGRVKKFGDNKGGVDCIGLIIGVAQELDIKIGGHKAAELDVNGYAKIPQGDDLLLAFELHLAPVSPEHARLADILMFRFDKNPQHVAFLGEKNGTKTLIHSYLQARGVVEHRYDERWQERAVAGFRL